MQLHRPARATVVFIAALGDRATVAATARGRVAVAAASRHFASIAPAPGDLASVAATSRHSASVAPAWWNVAAIARAARSLIIRDAAAVGQRTRAGHVVAAPGRNIDAVIDDRVTAERDDRRLGRR